MNLSNLGRYRRDRNSERNDLLRALDNPECNNQQINSPKALVHRLYIFLGFQTIIIIAFFFWIIGAFIALRLQHKELFYGLDGGYVLSVATRQMEWKVPLTTMTMDWFQGLGDIFYMYNARLLPAYYFVVGLGGILGKALAYTWWLAELTLSTVIFARVLGLGAAGAALAAVAACLLMFPFFGPGLLYPIVSLIPHIVTAISLSLLMASALVRFGCAGFARSIFWACAFVVGLLWMLFGSTFATILAAPFLLLSGVSTVIGAPSRSERLMKILLVGICSLILLLTGPVAFMAGVLFNTAASMFPVELQNDRATFLFASILFHWNAYSPAGPVLVILAIAGALIAVYKRDNRMLFAFALTLLTYLGSRLSFAALTILFDFWRGPSPLYFEFFVVPLYAVFASYGLGQGAVRLFRRHSISDAATAAIIFILAPICAIALHLRPQPWDAQFHYPPAATPIIETLRDDVAEPPGMPFKGRVANVTGQMLGRSIGWMDLHLHDYDITASFGNDFRIFGLQYYSIPGLFEYTSTMTPAYYRVMKDLLARPDDMQMRSVSVARRINPQIMALLGVKYIITDAVFDGKAELVKTDKNGASTLYLYKIANPNIGNYSPVSVYKMGSIEKAISYFEKQNFDGNVDVLITDNGDFENLVPAENAVLSFEGDSLRIRATSSGSSLLVLPLEYSRCLSLESETSSARLLRVDLLETGVVFQKNIDAKLSVQFGPFTNPMCRLWDRFDVSELAVQENSHHANH